MLDHTNHSQADRVLNIVIDIIEKHSIDKQIMVDDDLRAAGLTSIDIVSLMLTVEAEFDLTIPESAMTIHNFRSVTSIDTLVSGIRAIG